jgi:sulfonate transport system permease protein
MSGAAETIHAATSREPPNTSRLRNPAFWRGLVLPVLLLAIWTIATQLGLVNKFIVVRPDKVVTRAIEEWRNGDLLPQLLASLQRDLLGVSLGSVAGLLVGGLMGISRLSDRLLGPTFHAAKQVALFAWVPLISVWCGTGEFAKVVFIGLAAFYPVVLHTYEGFHSVAKEHVDVARALEFSRSQIVRRVLFPSALPSLFAGLHLALIYGWLATIGAEYLLAPGRGVGNLMIDGRESFAMDKVLLGVVIAGAVGAGLNALAVQLETRLLRWRVSAFAGRS